MQSSWLWTCDSAWLGVGLIQSSEWSNSSWRLRFNLPKTAIPADLSPIQRFYIVQMSILLLPLTSCPILECSLDTGAICKQASICSYFPSLSTCLQMMTMYGEGMSQKGHVTPFQGLCLKPIKPSEHKFLLLFRCSVYKHSTLGDPANGGIFLKQSLWGR